MKNSMMAFRKRLEAIGIGWFVLCLAVLPAGAQSPATTTVSDTVYRSDGTVFSGTLVISWDPFLDSANKAIAGGSKTVAIPNGAFSVALVPNAGATPSGTSYRVRFYQSGQIFSEERWVVPSSGPVALAQVRVLGVPSPPVVIAASQVGGTAIVSNPNSTQTITAPSGSGIPLQITGRSNNSSNIFEIYDNQTQPQLRSYFNTSGALVSGPAPTFSAMNSGSVLFAGTGGLLSQDNAQLFWDAAAKGLKVGPRTGFGFPGYLNSFQHHFSLLNPSTTGMAALGAMAQDNTTKSFWGGYGVVDSRHTSGNRTIAVALEGDAFHNGAGGTVGTLEGVFGYAENGAGIGGDVTRVAGLASLAWHSGASTTTDLMGIWVRGNGRSAGTVTNNYGLKVEDQTAGTNKWAIKTGLGKVEFGDRLVAKNLGGVRMAEQFTGTDAGAKIAAAITDLPTAGGTVDARGLEGSQTISSTITISKPVVLLLGNATFSYSGTGTVFSVESSNVVIKGSSAQSTIISATSSTGDIISVIANSDWVQMKDFRVTGNTASSTNNCIKIVGAIFGVYENLELLNCGGAGMLLDDVSNNRTYFNRLVNLDISGSGSDGIKLTTTGTNIPNANVISGGRIRNRTTGLNIDRGQINQIDALDVENCDTGIRINDSNNTLVGVHAENNTTENLVITSSAGQTQIFSGSYDSISDNSGGSTEYHGVYNVSLGMQNYMSGFIRMNNHLTFPNNNGIRFVPQGGSTGLFWYDASETLESFILGNSGLTLRSGSATAQQDMALNAAHSSASVKVQNGGTDKLVVSGSLVDSKVAFRSTMTTVSSSATPTFDASLGNSFKMTLTANVTSSTISNSQTGQSITLLLCQDANGNRSMAWPTNLKLAGGTFTLTTTGNKCDSVTAVYDGTNWYETARASNL